MVPATVRMLRRLRRTARYELRPVRLFSGLWAVWSWHRWGRSDRLEQLGRTPASVTEGPGTAGAFRLWRNPTGPLERRPRSMFAGVDAITGSWSRRATCGFQPVQTLDQHEAVAVRAHQDRRLLALGEHAARFRRRGLGRASRAVSPARRYWRSRTSRVSS